jgi:hypothetical protein
MTCHSCCLLQMEDLKTLMPHSKGESKMRRNKVSSLRDRDLVFLVDRFGSCRLLTDLQTGGQSLTKNLIFSKKCVNMYAVLNGFLAHGNNAFRAKVLPRHVYSVLA